MQQSMGAHVRMALSVGVVGGFIVGCREALLSLQANAVIQPGEYFLLYAAVPLLTWIALGALLLLPFGVALGLRRSSEPRAWLWLYVAVLTCAGALSILLPWSATVTSSLSQVGMPVTFGVRVVLEGLAGALAVGTALILGGVVAAHASAVLRVLPYATVIAVSAAVLSLWPVGRFFARDWKWGHAQPAAASAAAAQPHVLLISVDTLRADHLGSYGSPHGLTPHLDRLAMDGIVFEQTIAASPWTLPAMASLFTGLYPRHHGAGAITNQWSPLGRAPLPPGSWTLATALRERGYRTHAIVTNPYLALHYGFGHGFDSYENVTIASEAFLSFRETTAGRLVNWLRPDLVIGDRGETVSERAQQWLDGVDAAQPFFLWLHYLDPHPPYNRAGVTNHKSLRGDMDLSRSAADPVSLTLTSPDVARLRSGEIRLGEAEKDAVRALYRAEVASMDAAVGLVLDTLDRRGLLSHTLVVFVADHGEEFWEHGGVEHGHTVYEEQVRVPFIMSWPGKLPTHTRIEHLVRTVDVAPTLLDLLAVPTRAVLDGSSLMPLVRGESTGPETALIENMLFAEERSGLRTAGHKYIRWASGKEEVYDLRRDPREQVDLAGIDAVVRPLRQLYAGLDRRPPAPAHAVVAPDETTRSAMRALGYLQ